MFDLKNEKLDIIVLAGQSNAEGGGLSTSNVFETRNDVYEIVDSNVCGFDESFNPPKMIITLPTVCKIQCLQERFSSTRICSSLSLSFVDLYKKSTHFDSSRKIMVVKCAVGGTGFFRNEWGVDGFLYKRSLRMIEEALSLNPENRIVAYLWHQGECDAFENRHLSDKQIFDFYCDKFMAQMLDFKNRYPQFNFPIIMGELCNEWSDLPENYHSTRAIEKALYECAKKLGNSAVASSEGLNSNNQDFGNGDNIHFSKQSLIELGKRYFKAFDKIKTNL